MNQGTFFENFEVLADAPNGVLKLRELIFQLAVQGKLVPQDPYDEPAAVLIEKITAKKERLIKEGKIRKPKPLSSNDVENPYELPLNWKWARLFDIGLINPRNEAKDDLTASFIPMTLISETYSIPISSERRLWGEIKSGFTHFAEEDVVLAKITPCFQNGKSAVMRNLLNGLGAGTTELHVFRPLLDESVNPDYVLLYLRSPQFLKEGIEKMTGTAGQKRVPRDYFAGNPFPLPPFEEQQRIVAKVDQLMALCDELEARQQKKQEQRILLNSAALNKLHTAPTPGEFAQHWQRICDNFDLLYDAPETVGQLRQAILQLAVQGKLVAQDPNNKPSSQLINDIIEERKKWYENECEMAINIGSRKPKKPKLTSIEFPEEYNQPKIPESWQYCFFEDVAASKENAIKAGPFGSSLTKNCYVPSGYKIYGQEQVIKGDASYGDYYIDDTKFTELRSCEVAPGDILISLVGTIGKVLILPNDCESGIINPRLVKLSLNAKINQRFIKIYLNAPIVKDILNDVSHGGTMNILNLKILKNLPIPIPPMEEQAQIVAKVDQLMDLCDELEAGLVQAQTDGGKLMEAVVHHVLAAK